MNPLQRLELFLTGIAYVGHRRRPGWKGSLPFFAFRCPIHGIVEDYPHGYYTKEDIGTWNIPIYTDGVRSKLSCPRCRREIRSVHPDLVEEVVQEALPIEK